MALMALPMANAAPSANQNPAFVNMISLFLNAPDQVPTNPSMTALTTSTPAQLADSMIKSMLGGGSPESTDPVGAQQPDASPVQIADSMIQSMLGKLSSGSTNDPAAVPAAPIPKKQLPVMPDLPTLTAMVAPPPAPAISTTPTANQTSPMGGAPNSTISSAPQLPVAPPATPVVKSEVAFTAILTPMKNINPPTGTADVARPVATPAVIPTSTTSVASPVAIATAATPVNPPQPAASQNSQSQAAIAPAGNASNGAQADGSKQQSGGDTSSQQDGSAGTPAKAVADAKVKPASSKQDDNEAVSAVPDHAPVANTTFTAFPEQSRVEVAPQADAPAAAPTPFHSTAEALRTAESNLPAAPQLRTAAAQEISVRIAQADSSTIDLRVVERSGQLHVDVRTTDAAMQTSLRQDLGTLTNSLNRAGYHSETFTPSSTLGRAALSSQMNNRDDSQNQDQSQKHGGSGGFSGGRRQQQQQKRTGLWLEELETIQ